MFSPATCVDLPSATSLQASACGATPCVKSVGQMIDMFGPVPALANLSARQAKEVGLMMSGTYGRPSSTSSSSAALQSCLENRLMQLFELDGGT